MARGSYMWKQKKMEYMSQVAKEDLIAPQKNRYQKEVVGDTRYKLQKVYQNGIWYIDNNNNMIKENRARGQRTSNINRSISRSHEYDYASYDNYHAVNYNYAVS
eukprot:UN05597